MKTFFRLCCSIIRRNKGFSAGIFVMSVLSVTIAFLGANLEQSSSDTVMKFISDSGTPDAIYVTDIVSEETGGEIGEIQGVSLVAPGFIYDTNIETEDGSLYSVRAFRRGDTPFTHTEHEEKAYDGEEPVAAVSSKFAEHNGIHAGDSVLIDTPLGRKKVVVESVVSNPETMSCVKDGMSAYENYQFAYLYFGDFDFNRLVPTEGLANQWLIYFEDGVTLSEQKECMGKIREVFAEHVISESFTEESEALNSVRDDIHTISVLCSFIPGIIWLISLGFNFIFIKIIVENQRKTIGMLRALGFSRGRVLKLFMAYTVVINVPALLCGIPAGNGLLRVCLELIAEAEGILNVTITISPWITAIMLLMVFAAGIISALMSAGSISGIDPCEAYGGRQNDVSEPPEFIGRIKTDAFLKISIVSIARNYKRQIVGGLCIAACIVSMCVGLEGVFSIGNPIDAVYGGRYRYDLMVRGIDSEAVSKIRNEVDGVTLVEPQTCFSGDFLGKTVRVSTISEEDELMVLTDEAGNRLLPGDGVIIDEMCADMNEISVGDYVELDGYLLPVTGIAREILYMVMYISPQTAAQMGYDGTNCVMIKLGDGTAINEVERQITEISDEAYLVEFTSQKENVSDAFKAMRTVMLLFAVLAFCIGSLLVFNIVIIDFNENRYRYAILRALGAPVKKLGVVAAVQNLFRVVLGIIIGCPLCFVCVSVLLRLLSGASQQYVMVKFGGCLLISCLVPLLYVLLGTCIALHKIRKMDFTGYLNETE